MGLDAIHSSMAICSISSRPNDDMHQAIPDRSIICPMSSSSGTSVTSWSWDSDAYLLVIELVPGVHLDGGVRIGPPVLAKPLLGGLATLRRNLGHGSVEARTEWEADVLGEENRDVLELILGELTVEHRGIDLNLGEVLQTEGRDGGQRNQPLLAHRQSGLGPDRAEQVVDGEIEVGIAFDVGHLPAVDLVHLGQALGAQFVHFVFLLASGSSLLRVRYTEAASQF